MGTTAAPIHAFIASFGPVPGFAIHASVEPEAFRASIKIAVSSMGRIEEMFDADRNHPTTSRNAEGTPVRPLLLETLERRLLLSADALLGAADPSLNLVPEDVPQVVENAELQAAGEEIQGPSEILAAPGPTQVIVPDPVTQAVLPGSAFSIMATYSTADPVDETVTGLGLRLHYNSSLVRWDSFSSVYAAGKIAQDSSPQNDTANYDGDPSTDKYLTIAWVDFSGGNWPGAGLTPLDLYVANFTALSAFAGGSTAINFSASSTAAGRTLDATSAIITLANLPPSVDLSNTVVSLPEDADTSSRVKVADIVVTDDALGTNVLSLDGTDAPLFEIEGLTLYLKAGAVLDYETTPVLEVVVAVDDASVGTTPDSTAALSLTVTDVNEAPTVGLTNTVTSLVESTDTASRIKVADIVVTDDTLGTNVLSLDGAEAALFEIVDAVLYLRAGTALDYETLATLNVTVAVDDAGVGTAPDGIAVLAIDITDVNEAPTVALANTVTNLAENTDTTSRIKVADVVVTDDALGTNVLSLDGTHAALFEIEGLTLYLQASTALDYETNPTLDVTVVVQDATLGAGDAATLTISVTDVNEPPTTTLTNTTTGLVENTSTTLRLKVADIVVTDDALGVNNLSLSGVDGALFEIDGSELYLKAGTVLDYETNPVLDVTVAVDDTEVGATPDAEAPLSISITDVNEAATVALENTITSLPEDTATASGVKVAAIVVTDDALGTNVLSLSGIQAALFEIEGLTLYLKAGTTLDYETTSVLEVVVAVDDAGVGATPDSSAALSITVTDVNEAPTVVLANTVTSLAEDTDTSSAIQVAGIVVTDDALGTNVLSLEGAHAALFEIVDTSLYLKAGTALDYETQVVLEVTVAVDDAGVGTAPDGAAALSITVTDVNEAPAVALANTVTSLTENTDTTSQVKVADIVVADDALGTNVLSLSGAEAALFEIEGLTLYLKAGTALDYETTPVLEVVVAVDDASVGSTPDSTAALSLTITDVNQPPTVALTNTVTSLAEDTDVASGVRVADIVVTDDALGANVLSLEGADAALFEIVGAGLYVKAGTVLDYETKPALNAVVAVDDPAVGATPDGTVALSLTVTDVNEAPTVALANTVTSLAEDTDTASRIRVTDIVVTDDALGANVLSLSGAQAALFEIEGLTLYLKAGTTLDFETTPVLEVVVAVDDAGVGSTPDSTAALSIAVTDVNEAPVVALANTVTSLAENADTTSRIKVADIVVTDDALGVNVLSLAGAQAALFEIDGLALYLQAGTALDYETSPLLEVTVSVDDASVGTTPDGTAALSITVADVNEAPTITLADVVTSLPENVDTTSRVKIADIVVTDDALGTNELSLSGTDAALFEVDPTVLAGSGTAGLYLRAGTTLDYETTAVLEVIVVVDNDDVGSTPDGMATLTIMVTNVNEAPTVALANIVTSLAEDTDTTSRVKVADIVVADDALGTNVLSLSGADAALFEIVDTALYLKAGTVLDYETTPILEVVVVVDDAGVGSTPDATAALLIPVTDVNEAPTVALTSTVTSLAENTDTTSRVKVADIVVTDDALGTNVLSLSGTDATLFEIDGLALYLQAGTTLDYAANPVLEVIVTVDDAGVGVTPDSTAALSISITDVNQPPTVELTNTVTSLLENTDTTCPVKVADIVVTGDALGTDVLSVEGADAALFEIVDTGLYLKAGTVLDYETKAVLNVAVGLDDAAVMSTADATAALSINIIDVNEAPTVALANMVTSLAENTDTSSRIKVADVAVLDDASGVNALSLDGADAALFEIVDTGLYLRAGTVLDYETKAILNVAVTVDDADVGGTPDGTAALALSIADVNEPPVVVNDTATTDEDTPVIISAASLLSNDSDPDADMLSIVSIDTAGTRGSVIDNGDGTYTYDPRGQFDYLPIGASAADSFLVTVGDGHGLTATGTVTITVTGTSDLVIDKYSVRSGKTTDNNCIKMSGSFDIPETELVAGERIRVRIFASSGPKLFDDVITIDAADLRQGVYTYRVSLPKGSSGAVALLKLDTRRQTFDLWVEGLDLSRLSYPLKLQLGVGDYVGSAQTD
jgi:protocadherin Fat 4